MTVDITYNTSEQQYEITVDGAVAGHTVARDEGDVVVFPHTEIDERFEGRGLGGKLVGHALDDVRSRGKKVRAHCTYVKHFIEKHPEYQDLRAE
ncbi:GNAT family N-acetyltransferase [Aeromicrobium sp. 636]|uniref:N-acetyltransferase n=1 Tax=Aeromicrobium senzhongii TaxID=2663859 RepID=A0A8I0EVY7_9ACTN|nr:MULTISPECIES: GNAT family N-acetyltransferase [Aeromicrobium]MBC9227189.1 N-acetyltransferase [Aeromicrobium senzhongii]MCQ3999288.1 GNAT family N-acetyltransferase [Aeromicrobium sp. 636]MTB88400.1 GNAT family N-acetyltransferase [Aeromicrobium senzhongii]QNL94631.1 N-acetyltransferase [Aeromicrobium senzhongii]